VAGGAKHRVFNNLREFLRAAGDVRRNISVELLYKWQIRARLLDLYRPLKH
jgi:hypothetical protein